jgi:hypothetical protein
MKDSFDRWLDSNLNNDLDRVMETRAWVAPRYRAPRATHTLRPLGLTSIPLALSFRLVTALAAAGLAAAGGTAVLISSHPSGPHPVTQGSASTHNSPTASGASTRHSSSGPAASNHGKAVASAVATCQASRPSPHSIPKPTPGSRGIGSCVSDVASGGHAKGGSHSPPPHPTPKPHPTPRATF